jgi:hypothetical protein
MVGRVEEPGGIGPRWMILGSFAIFHTDQHEAVFGDPRGVIGQNVVETETLADSAHARSVAEG